MSIAGSPRVEQPPQHERIVRSHVAPLKNFAHRIVTAILVAATLIFSMAPALAQMNTGEIDGVVRDPSGAVIVSAAIAAVESGTQLKYSTRTNESGEFLLAQLPVGEYTLTVSKDGFKQVVQSKISMHAGDRLRQTFTLELGMQSETVTISANQSLLQVESAAIRIPSSSNRS